jgi:hypothetical protein
VMCWAHGDCGDPEAGLTGGIRKRKVVGADRESRS